MDVFERLLQAKIIAILRGNYDGRWQDVADALVSGGIYALEITLNSPDALAGLNLLKASLGNRIILGAGTVLNVEQALSAINAGAEFIVAPDTDEKVIAACLERNVPVFPGAYTPTEIKRAYQFGAKMVKVFPVPDPAYIKAICGPLDYIPLMATGGVAVDNVADYFKAGVSAVGVGGSLAKPGLSPVEIEIRARAFVTAMRGNEAVTNAHANH